MSPRIAVAYRQAPAGATELRRALVSPGPIQFLIVDLVLDVGPTRQLMMSDKPQERPLISKEHLVDANQRRFHSMTRRSAMECPVIGAISKAHVHVQVQADSRASR